jgi:hypothetical protein
VGRDRESGDDRARESSSRIGDDGGTEPDSREKSSSADAREQQVLEKLKKAREAARRAADPVETGDSEKDHD